MNSALLGSPRQQLQRSNLEKVLRGQQRLETVVEGLRRSIDRLPEVLRTELGVPANLQRSQEVLDVQPMQTLQSHRFPQEPPTSAPTLPGVNVRREPRDTAFSPTHLDAMLSQMPFGTSNSIDSQKRRTSSGGLEESVGVVRAKNSFSAAETCRPTATTLHSSPRRGNVSNHSTLHKAHGVFDELVQGMLRTDHANLRELANQWHSRKTSVQPSVPGGERGEWTPIFFGFVIHPASRFCTILDGVRALFLLSDVILVPYLLAWDVALEGLLYYVALLVVCFWTTDLTLNFITGYISDGSVVMHLRLIAKHYIRRGFVIDIVALLVECMDLLAATASSSMAPDSLQIFKVLRFFKITRLVRIVAKVRSGLLERIHGALSYWIQVHGFRHYQYTLNFAGIILKLIFVITWLGHIGSCIWYGLGRSLPPESETWQDVYVGEMSSYIRGLYWSLSTIFSGSSYVQPHNTREAILSVFWVIMGAMFVTSITSTLAATLIESQEKQLEVTKKIRALTSFMGQRKTPVLLSLAVQANFNDKVLTALPLTELDLPFLDQLTPGLRASLRECQYADAFARRPFFRMLGSLHEGAIKALAFAAHVAMVKDGEEVFGKQQEMEHALLLYRGKMSYNYSPSASQAALGYEMSLHANGTLMGRMDSFGVFDSVGVEPDTWICELALLVSWSTLGALESTAACELLLMPTDQFIKVTTGFPITAAVVSSYSLRVVEVLGQLAAEGRLACTDLETGIDCDVVTSEIHMFIRGMISRPILEFTRKQNRIMTLLRRGTLLDLEQEMLQGKCHLVMGDDGPTSIRRVVRVVVLRLNNKDGAVCVHLMEVLHGRRTAKFHLPGSKVFGNERPDDALKRLLETDLSMLAPAIRVVDVETAVEFDNSRTFGLQTKYIKTIYRAELAADMVRGLMTVVPPPVLLQERSMTMKTHSDLPSVADSVGASNPSSQAGKKDSRKVRLSSKDPSSLGGRRSCEVSMLSSHFDNLLDMESEYPRAFCILDKQVIAERPSKTSTATSTGGAAVVATESAALRPSFDPAAVDLGLGRTSLYRWMSEDDFENLSLKRQEVEQELLLTMSGLSVRDWQKLSSWELQGLDAESRSGDAVVFEQLTTGPHHEGLAERIGDAMLKELSWTAVL